MFVVDEEVALCDAGPVNGAEVEAQILDGVGCDVYDGGCCAGLDEGFVGGDEFEGAWPVPGILVGNALRGQGLAEGQLDVVGLRDGRLRRDL